MATKADIINRAYGALRISGITRTPTPEETTTALEKLEDLMAEWEGGGTCIGYNFHPLFNGAPDANSTTGVHRRYNRAMYLNLAIELIPDFNKEVPPELIKNASGAKARASSMSLADRMRNVQPSRRMPRGMVETLRFNRWRRYSRPESLPPNECATNYLMIGEINDYEESFQSYLDTGELINTYTIEADTGITITSNALNFVENIVQYSVRADSNTQEGVWKQVKISVVTTSGREEIRIINFGVRSSETIGGN